jgi:hypothetical protein
MILSIKAKVTDSCIEVIIDRSVIRSHHLTRKIPSYFDEVASRSQSNPYLYVVLATHVHTPDARQMGIDVGEDSIWMTRSDQSQDPLDGQVCCSAIPSVNSQLFETMCWIPSMMVMTTNGQRTHSIIAKIRTPKLQKSYWP